MPNHEDRLMKVDLDQNKNQSYVNGLWEASIIPTLKEYITIPNKSPQFDPNWQQNGYMDQAVNLAYNWCKSHAVANMNIEVIQLENRTPVLLLEIPGASQETILLYGHLDKQPEMSGWSDGLSPWKPVLKGEKLYGRGAADDGYAVFASLAAIKSLQEQQIPHARCVILIETSEESGSSDLPFYIEALKDRLGQPSLVICLDSGCGNYEQLWVTTSLRGLVGGTLKIKVLSQGIHSGMGSGIVPSCFRILRLLLDRIEDAKSGIVALKDLHVEIPSIRIQQAEQAAAVLGNAIYTDLPFIDRKTQPETFSLKDLLLRRTWCPALSVIGLDGLPCIQDAGNVTVPELAVKLSMRLPPLSSPESAAKILKTALETDTPYDAKVSFEINDQGPGWNAPTEAKWLEKAINQASQHYFSKEAMYMGEGGSIPFMGMLGEKFPMAQFLITGVLGPESNAHGPNEFLHLPTAKKLTASIAEVIASHYCRANN